MKPEAKGWRDIYDFDVPVVSYSSRVWAVSALQFAKIAVRFTSAKHSCRKKTRTSHQKQSS